MTCSSWRTMVVALALSCGACATTATRAPGIEGRSRAMRTTRRRNPSPRIRLISFTSTPCSFRRDNPSAEATAACGEAPRASIGRSCAWR